MKIGSFLHVNITLLAMEQVIKKVINFIHNDEDMRK